MVARSLQSSPRSPASSPLKRTSIYIPTGMMSSVRGLSEIYNLLSKHIYETKDEGSGSERRDPFRHLDTETITKMHRRHCMRGGTISRSI